MYFPVRIHHPESVLGQEAEGRVGFGDFCKLVHSHHPRPSIWLPLPQRCFVYIVETMAIVMPVEKVTFQQDFLYTIFE